VPEGQGIRVDTHGYEGYEVPPFYDSLLAKLIVHGRDRADALERAREALATFTVEGVDTNVDMHRSILHHPDFLADAVDTRWLERTLLPEFAQRSSVDSQEGSH
jgi:acetyl-CoA carboxylase biotin carboxylase subunit